MLTFQEEKISTILSEIKPLLILHCLEAVPSTINVDTVNFDIYGVLEEAKALHIITARDAQGALCGYAIYLLAPDMHNQNFLTATSDAFYLLPKCRGWEGVKLMQCAEKTLMQRGVKSIVNTVPTQICMDGFMQRLGYDAVSIQYIKKMEV